MPMMMVALGLSLPAAPVGARGQDAAPPTEPGAKPQAVQPAPPADPDGGRVVLNCAMQADGSMTDCRIEEETPAGAGFGQAALRVAAEVRLPEAQARSIEPGSRVQWATRFRLDD